MKTVRAWGKEYEVNYSKNDDGSITATPGTLSAYKGTGKTAEEAFSYMNGRMNPPKADANWN